jgi:hypothetical protein
MPSQSWYTEHSAVEENVVPGKRLGRVVRHDSRSLAYRYQATGVTLTSQLWPRHIAILDQGAVGSCTGNAEVGELGTDPLYSTLTADRQGKLNEAEALALYSAAETIDGDGPYPPNDNGSSGLSVCQAAKNAGWISGYVHCLSLADVLDALETGPVIIGSNWYSSFDTPDASGLVAISPAAYVRGGHEYLCRGKDVTKQLVHLDNSWGTSFGVAGSFTYSWATLTRLLAEQGDATVSVPVTAPVPVPVPVPTPTPTPTPGPDTNPADLALAAATKTWSGQRHFGSDVRVATALRTWLTARGL